MGMCTEICISGELRRDTPLDVQEMCRFLFDGSPSNGDVTWFDGPPPLSHPFFECPRWQILFGSSCYFCGDSSTSWREVDLSFTGRGHLKNNSEIEQFIDWIAPYVRDDGGGSFAGHTRYEDSVAPTLVWWADGKAIYQTIAPPPEVTP